MELSVSLSDEDVATIDDVARRQGLAGRSAAVQFAIRQLRRAGLEQDYLAAWQEWDASGDRDAWEATTGDGLGAGPSDAPR